VIILDVKERNHQCWRGTPQKIVSSGSQVFFDDFEFSMHWHSITVESDARTKSCRPLFCHGVSTAGLSVLPKLRPKGEKDTFLCMSTWCHCDMVRDSSILRIVNGMWYGFAIVWYAVLMWMTVYLLSWWHCVAFATEAKR